ncbi:hypothetical protein CVT26_008392 [Gymnopilus dilepis]|uniref:Uncharacterized protein n=1 Tax=Gymnopilus dilepis TaxID=231916 RepID=A0A409Y948_9AGAR|nr:hypothetical protein CVT26_008392 [Gymnopilus dilepis]
MFSAIRDVQRQSQDLVVYSRVANSVVKIAWPTRKGAPIVPRGIKNFLDGRGVFWECFCAVLSSEARPCRIVASRNNRDVFAFCHGTEGDPNCGFYLNLTKKVNTTSLFSDYGHLPSAKTGRRANMSPYILSHRLATSLSETAPFFEGYLGEFTHEHGGITQLNSSIGLRYEIPATTRGFDWRTSRCRKSIDDESIVETSAERRRIGERRKEQGKIISLVDRPSFKADVVDLWAYDETQWPSVSNTEQSGDGVVHCTLTGRTSLVREVSVEQLPKEEGLTKSEFESLMERCNACQRYFFPRTLREHIPKCTSVTHQIDFEC